MIDAAKENNERLAKRKTNIVAHTSPASKRLKFVGAPLYENRHFVLTIKGTFSG